MPMYRSVDTVFDLSEAFPGATRINRETGVIEGVVMLTGLKKTRNSTFYTESALNEAAARYEGAKMFIDHPKKGEDNRSVRDYGGVYKNVRREANKIVGDLHVHEGVRNLIIPIAEQRAKGVGLSIRDKGRGREENGVFLVEGFKDGATRSIDFVSEVSSNEDLFESKKDEGGDEMDFSKLTKEELEKNRMDLVEGFRADGKAAIAKELEEAKQTAATAEEKSLLADKLIALSEANFKPEVAAQVRKMIADKAISLDQAKATITAQKELIEAVLKAKPTNGEPKVTGRGASQKSVEEGVKELPSDDELAEAFKSTSRI